MKWIDALLNADVEMAAHAKWHKQAKLEIFYYKDKGDKVRRKLVVSGQSVSEFIDEVVVSKPIQD